MNATLDSVFAAAMSLDANYRRDLAERFWDQVQPHDDAAFSEATWQQIGRRMTASDAGNVKLISGDVALAQLRAEFGFTSAG